MGDWVVDNYYAPELFPDGKPDREYLDERFPHTPVLVRDTSLHKALPNAEGLRRIGVDPESGSSSPPLGGVYVSRADGSMTGELMEVATEQAWLKLPVPPLSTIKRSIMYGINSCHKFGSKTETPIKIAPLLV